MLVIHALFALFGIVVPLHPYYVSIYDVNYSESTTFQITGKLFIDDLEEGILRTSGVSGLFIGTDKEHEEANTHIEQYVRKGMRLTVDDTPLNVNFLGKEVELDVCYVYWESESVPDWKHLDMENSVLIETISGQINIVHIQEGRKRKSYLLQKGDTSLRHKR